MNREAAIRIGRSLFWKKLKPYQRLFLQEKAYLLFYEDFGKWEEEFQLFNSRPSIRDIPTTCGSWMTRATFVKYLRKKGWDRIRDGVPVIFDEIEQMEFDILRR
jgi:hypothetical protein